MNKLYDTINDFKEKDFVWGESDCCQFVGHYILQVTGTDHRLQYGLYDTAIGAALAQRKHGNFKDLMDDNFEVIEVGFQQRGDVVMISTDEGSALALQSASDVWAMTEEDGLSSVNHPVERVWRIK